jgi:hypothetical protein
MSKGGGKCFLAVDLQEFSRSSDGGSWFLWQQAIPCPHPHPRSEGSGIRLCHRSNNPKTLPRKSYNPPRCAHSGFTFPILDNNQSISCPTWINRSWTAFRLDYVTCSTSPIKRTHRNFQCWLIQSRTVWKTVQINTPFLRCGVHDVHIWTNNML